MASCGLWATTSSDTRCGKEASCNRRRRVSAGSGRSEVPLHDGARVFRRHLALLGGLGEGHGKEKEKQKEARLHRTVDGCAAWRVPARRVVRTGRGPSAPGRRAGRLVQVVAVAMRHPSVDLLGVGGQELPQGAHQLIDPLVLGNGSVVANRGLNRWIGPRSAAQAPSGLLEAAAEEEPFPAAVRSIFTTLLRSTVMPSNGFGRSGGQSVASPLYYSHRAGRVNTAVIDSWPMQPRDCHGTSAT